MHDTPVKLLPEKETQRDRLVTAFETPRNGCRQRIVYVVNRLVRRQSIADQPTNDVPENALEQRDPGVVAQRRAQLPRVRAHTVGMAPAWRRRAAARNGLSDRRMQSGRAQTAVAAPRRE